MQVNSSVPTFGCARCTPGRQAVQKLVDWEVPREEAIKIMNTNFPRGHWFSIVDAARHKSHMKIFRQSISDIPLEILKRFKPSYSFIKHTKEGKPYSFWAPIADYNERR